MKHRKLMVYILVTTKLFTIVTLWENFQHLKRINLSLKVECASPKALITEEATYQTPIPFTICFNFLDDIPVWSPLHNLKNTAKEIGVRNRIKIHE